MSRPRRFLIVLLTVLIAAGVLGWLARMYLSSQRLTAQVASRLQAAYGASVQLREADLGIRSSSLRDVQLFEPEASSEAEPWLVIHNAQANIPLWDLIKSDALPSQLTLTGVAITLRFDKAGHLLTRIPTSGSKPERLPDVTINDGQITIRQEGHPDFVVTGVHTEVRDHNPELALTGSVADPTWGDWTVHGTANRKTDTGSATLKTPDVHFTQDKLERLPFIPESIWSQVKLRGDTAIACDIRYDAAAGRPHYHITLEPRATQLDLPSIALHADHGRGTIIVDDAVISVPDLQAQAADGEIKTTGKVDLGSTPARLNFTVDASNLNLDKIPPSWGLPHFQGRPLLSGHADLQVTLFDGKIQTNGSGQGMITGVRIPGAPESKPILLKLYPSGEGFRFTSPSSDSDFGLNPLLAPLVVLAVAQVAPQQPAPQDVVISPADVVNFIGKGVLRSVDALARAGSDFIGRLPKRRPASAQPQATPSYVEAQLGLDNVDVAQLVKGLNVPLPFPLTGRISFNVQVAFPLDTPRDLKTYRLRGTVTSPQLTFAGLEVEKLRARVTYSEGVLRLEELDGHIPEAHAGTRPQNGGSFHGSARLQVIPSGDLTAYVKLQAIPLDRTLAFMPKVAEQARGAFSGNMDVRVPATELKNPAAWQASGTITAERLELYGLALERAAVVLRVSQGTAAIQAARAILEQTPIAASAELGLTDPYPFTGKLDLQADLAALQHLSPEVKLPVPVRGNFHAAAEIKGTLEPFVAHTSGTGTSLDLAIDRLSIGALRFGWQSDLERVRVTDVQARLYGGELSGSAVLPLQAKLPGQIDVRIQDLDVGSLSKDVPNLPIRLEGRATGRLEGTLSAADKGRPREFTSKLELQAPQLRVQGIPTERLHGSVDYRNQAVTYQFEGETLGGRFHLNGQIPSKPQPAAPGLQEGRLRLEGARLGRLAEALHLRTALPDLRGILNVDVTFRHAGRHREPVGGGRFFLERLRWGPTSPIGAIQGEIVLTEGELRLRNLAGELAQGVPRGQVVLNLRQPDRSWFSLVLDQVEASQLLAPWPDVADRVEGALQVRLRGTLGARWFGGGDIALARGRVSGLDVLDWRLPFDWAFSPSLGTAEVEVREGSGQLALGRVVSRASLAWRSGLRVEGYVRFTGVELRPVVRQITELSQLGTGRVSGRFDFSGTDVHSVDDLSGRLEARLEQTQALQLPVLQQVAPFLLGGQSSATVFQTGSLRGRLAGGTFRIDQLTFAGSLLQMFIDGTITLAGRLNLQVTANTGNVGINPAFVRFLGLRIPAVGPVPVSLLMEASTYFSNRVVHLRVTGTVRSPIITVEPLSLLTEEALRFFVNRSSVPVP